MLEEIFVLNLIEENLDDKIGGKGLESNTSKLFVGIN